MIRRHNFQSKQNGIVLLSCLIFLLMLLTLMRFTTGSAKLSEMKAGADFDQMNAEQTAQKVMHDAELFILRKGSNGKLIDNPAIPADINNITENEKNTMLTAAIKFWKDDSNLWKDKIDKKNNKPGIYKTPGIYDGDTDPCTDDQCTNHVTSWIKGDGAVSTDGGFYIIERFTVGSSGLNLAQTDAEKAIVLRVTAMGSSNKSIVGDNTSKVLLQNTYILTQQ